MHHPFLPEKFNAERLVAETSEEQVLFGQLGAYMGWERYKSPKLTCVVGEMGRLRRLFGPRQALTASEMSPRDPTVSLRRRLRMMSPAWHIYRGLPLQLNDQIISIKSHPSTATFGQPACLSHGQRDEEPRILGVSSHIFHAFHSIHFSSQKISAPSLLGSSSPLSLEVLTVGLFTVV